VAGLVAEGLTNRQIAERLVLSRETVTTHVKHILNKTGLERRSQIAALAVRESLGAPAAADTAAAAMPGRRPLPRVLLICAGLALAGLTALLAVERREPPPPRGLLFQFEPRSAADHFQGLARVDGAELTLVVPSAKQRLTAASHPVENTIDYLPDGIQLAAATNLTAVSLLGYHYSDAHLEVRAREIRGALGYTIHLRGCANDEADFFRIDANPGKGLLAIYRARCNVGTIVSTLLSPSRRLPEAPLGVEQTLGISTTGGTIQVASNGQVVAQVSDSGPTLPPGGFRFGVLPDNVALLTGFDLSSLT
jgi:hypothetical protein